MKVLKPGVPRVYLDDTALYLFSRTSVAAVYGWPRPRAMQKTIFASRWAPLRPVFDLNGGVVSAPSWEDPAPGAGGPAALVQAGQFELPFPGVELDLQRKKAEACSRFLSRIPEEVRQAVGVFPLGKRVGTVWPAAGQWEVLLLLSQCCEATDLALSNPCMLFALSVLGVFHPVRDPVRAVRRLVRRPQKEVAGYLGFVESKPMAKVMRSIVPGDVSLVGLLALRRAVQDGAALKLLRHVSAVTACVLRLVTDARLQRHVTRR